MDFIAVKIKKKIKCTKKIKCLGNQKSTLYRKSHATRTFLFSNKKKTKPNIDARFAKEKFH